MKIFDADLALLGSSDLLDAAWYADTYPDVAQLGMPAAVHYLRYGARMGRDPSPGFATRNYLRAYPDVARIGMNPLLHYLRHGRAENRAPRPDPGMLAEQEVARVRGKLLGLGFGLPALEDLARLAEDPSTPDATAASARREIALWYMRQGDHAKALPVLARAAETAPDDIFRSRIATAEILCHRALRHPEAGRAAFARAEAASVVRDNVLLARASLEDRPGDRLDWINRALACHAIAPVRLMDGPAPPYDRLTAVRTPRPVRDGPKVTVLIAAYKAAETLPTALRSLREQTWQNLEILVIDDASPDGGATVAAARACAARDPRIRIERMPVNGGAYVARNRGLELATGAFVTLHDSDDWSHPVKIETQMRHMADHPETIACTSQQARGRPDLRFTRWTGRCDFIIHNTSSLLFRKAPVRAALGHWDTVRFAADSEMIRRMRRAFGAKAVVDLPTGPLSFQRDGETSVVADAITGMNGFYFGVRKEYFEAQIHFHGRAETLRYDGDPAHRPFPVPAMMRPDRPGPTDEPPRLDLVLAGDFRADGPGLRRALDRVCAETASGGRVGLVETYDYDAPVGTTKRIRPELRDLIDGETCRMLVYGETAVCTRFEHLSGSLGTRYLPRIVLTDGSAAFVQQDPVVAVQK